MILPFVSPLPPCATLDHQDKMSLALMISSIGIVRYLSGIRPVVLLFSSSIRYTGLNILSNAGTLCLTLVSLYPSQYGPEALIRKYKRQSVSEHTIRPLTVVRSQGNCERDPIFQHNTTQLCL